MFPDQLVIVLITISTALIAFMLPFGYTFAKNLDEDLSKEIDEALKLLKEAEEKKSKGYKIAEDAENLKDKVRRARRRISNFNTAVKIGLGTILFSCLGSIFFGVLILLNEASNYSAKVIMFMLYIESAALIYYFVILSIYKPLKELNKLRDKKTRIYLKMQKIDHDFIFTFTNQSLEKRRNKMKRWNITQLMAAGSVGALMAAFFIIGASISAVIGILGAGGIISAIFSGILFAFCCLAIRRFGSATLTGFVFSICALPFPILGPSGFLPKILIGTSAGLAVDLIYFLFKKREKIAATIIGAGSAVLITFEFIGLTLLFSIPGAKKTAGLFFSTHAIFIFLLMGGIGGYIGYIVFNKLRNTAVIRRIQG